MKYFLLLFFLLLPFIGISQNENSYPIDPNSNKITIEKTIKIPSTSKEKLFKRIQQFLADQNFDRIESFKTHEKNVYTGQIVYKPITYQDLDEGKVFGNGFLNYKYRGHSYFAMLFTFKIYVSDNEYRYVFTNFTVAEFINAGKSVNRNSVMTWSGGSTSAISGVEIRSFPLEDFIHKSAYSRSEDEFLDNLGELKHKLKVAMLGNL